MRNKPHIKKRKGGQWKFFMAGLEIPTFAQHQLNIQTDTFLTRLNNEIRYATYRRMVALSEATSSGVQQ